jgi:hypothetical protein
MSVHTLNRAAGAAAVAALALVLAACSDDAGSGDQDSGDAAASEAPAADLTPQEALLASVDGLGDDSYTLESTMTLNGMDYLVFIETQDGDARRTSNDLYWSILPDAMGLTEEEASYMGDFFTDSHTEMITVGDTVYVQYSGSDDAAIAEEFGADAWFTKDATDDADIEAGAGFGNAAIIGELTEVKETGDGVYTAVLPADSAAMLELVGAGADEEAVPVDGAVTIELDENGVFKRMSMEVPESGGMAYTFVSELTETGVDYDIKAPDSANLHTHEEYEAAILGA